MRKVWPLLTLTLMLHPAAMAGEPTPMDRILPADAVSLIAVHSIYSPPQGVHGWPTDNLFHYRLYLPGDYYADSERKYPLMFIASPHGDADMAEMAAPLKRDRWIVAMLVESRNDSVLWLPDFVAAYDDVIRRVRVHERMIFCTGLSGAARACSAYPGVRPGFQGLILQAAGFMKRPDHLVGDNAHVVVYGTFGAHDFNLREARRLRVSLPPHTRRLVEVWDGGHAWAPEEVFERALSWVEAKSLVEGDYDDRLADAYRWYFTNELARFDRSQSDIERYTLNQLVQTLPERWRLRLDETTSRKLQAISEAVTALAGDQALKREIRARDAFHEVLALDEASRGADLRDLAERYGMIDEQYAGTVGGRLAGIRRRSLLRESGDGRQ
jgi:hypothetical protein